MATAKATGIYLLISLNPETLRSSMSKDTEQLLLRPGGPKEFDMPLVEG